MKTGRRDFLKLTAAATAAGPTLWLKKVRAATPGSAKHVLILFARGGLRSHCLFNAVGEFQHNPFGTQTAAVGTDWVLGAGCGTYDIDTTTYGTLPGFHQISNDVGVLACVDHEPGGAPDVNHQSAINRISTGDTSGRDGLLSRIGKDHPNFANGFSLSAVPPVELQPSEFGAGSGDFAGTRPLTVLEAGGFASELPVGQGWKMSARQALDARFRDRRSRAFRPRISDLLLHKTNTALFSGLLQDPLLDVIGSPDATDGTFTNAQLLEILGNYNLLEIGDYNSIQSWGPDIATALRFFAFGSPVSVVTRSIYDMHNDEADGFEPRTRDLVRQLAGLNYILKNMPHPDGGVFWDHTVVTVVSEFSRNNTLPGTGFNTGNGSDHVTSDPDPSRNQAVPLMGGPVSAAGGKLIGATNASMTAQDVVFSSRSLLSTLLDLLGVDPALYWSDAAISELYV
jgi:hypothetical protein